MSTEQNNHSFPPVPSTNVPVGTSPVLSDLSSSTLSSTHKINIPPQHANPAMNTTGNPENSQFVIPQGINDPSYMEIRTVSEKPEEYQSEVEKNFVSQIQNLEEQVTICNNLNEVLKKQVKVHKDKEKVFEKRLAELEEKCGSLEASIRTKIDGKPHKNIFSDDTIAVMEEIAVENLTDLNDRMDFGRAKRRRSTNNSDFDTGSLRSKIRATLSRKGSIAGSVTSNGGDKMRKSPKSRNRTARRVNSSTEKLAATQISEEAMKIIETQFQAKTDTTARANLNPCNCKKSRCLKLYCDCFAARQYCSGCNCLDCQNIPGTASRYEAIHTILSRRPDAFNPKVDEEPAEQETDKTVVHSKGCNCKKSHCLKKYCECYQLNAYCGPNCKCVECQNFEGSISCPRYFQKQIMSMLDSAGTSAAQKNSKSEKTSNSVSSSNNNGAQNTENDPVAKSEAVDTLNEEKRNEPSITLSDEAKIEKSNSTTADLVDRKESPKTSRMEEDNEDDQHEVLHDHDIFPDGVDPLPAHDSNFSRPDDELPPHLSTEDFMESI